MKLLIYILIIALNYLPLHAQDTTRIQIYKLGTAEVTVVSKCFIACDTSITYLNVHENENTSVKAAEIFLQKKGGILAHLMHTGERYISFYIGHKKFFIDPNRIYTKKGIAATLKKLGHFNPIAAKQVDSFSTLLLKQFVDNKKLIVALHNNTDNNYSIESYNVGGDEALNTAALFINDQMDPDDFIITTDSTLFHLIKENNINVVLQDNKRVVDDGSLSVYAAQKNIPYLNIEAQEGHFNEQLNMLNTIQQIIIKFMNLSTTQPQIEVKE